MKAVKKLVVLLSAGVLLPAVVSATSAEDAYLESCRKDSGVPVPVAVVSPSVGPGYHGALVQLEFVVDVSGKPVDLAVKSAPDDTLASIVLDAVKQWKFTPAVKDGVAVETKVLLPVKIVDPLMEGLRFAARD